jgi:hypothetical protein
MNTEVDYFLKMSTGSILTAQKLTSSHMEIASSLLLSLSTIR